MKNRKNKLYTIMITATLFLSQSMTVFAVTESDVEAVGKETAAGNVFIWFLCAIAFLKISQKIDSFLSSLGINVGHTGGRYKYALSMVYAKPVRFLSCPPFCMYGLCNPYIQFLPIYDTTITCGRTIIPQT